MPEEPTKPTKPNQAGTPQQGEAPPARTGGSDRPQTGRIVFRPLDEQQSVPGPAVGDFGRTRLPDAPAREKRVPGKAVVRVKAPASPSVPTVVLSRMQRNLPPDEPQDKRDARSLSREEDERKRLLTAAGFGARQGVSRVNWTNQLVFRCPYCEQQLQRDESTIGRIVECDSCGAEMLLPSPESGAKVELLKAGAQTATGEDSALIELPDERGEDGPAGKPTHQSVDELLPEGDEGGHAWGLEKSDAETIARRTNRTGVGIGLLLVALLLGLLGWHTYRAHGRAAGDSHPMPDIVKDTQGKVNWEEMPSLGKYNLAESTVRRFLSAPDPAAKAAVSRGGEAILPRMESYYNDIGGYVSETAQHGAVNSVYLGEERQVGGCLVDMVKISFADRTSGIYALVRGRDGYEVDWEYAVGAGDMSFTAMLEQKPAQPVMMRVYLEEGFLFGDGFTGAEWRQFDMSDFGNRHTASAYVRRDSAAEDVLREAYREEAVRANMRGRKGPTKFLDFVVRVRFESSGGRVGFVIDEVLSRGWILPEQSR